MHMEEAKSLIQKLEGEIRPWKKEYKDAKKLLAQILHENSEMEAFRGLDPSFPTYYEWGQNARAYAEKRIAELEDKIHPRQLE